MSGSARWRTHWLISTQVLRTAAGLVKSANLASAVDSLLEDMAEGSLKKYCGHELAKDKDVDTCIEEGGRKGKTIKDSYREQFVRNLASDDYLVLGWCSSRSSPCCK